MTEELSLSEFYQCALTELNGRVLALTALIGHRLLPDIATIRLIPWEKLHETEGLRDVFEWYQRLVDLRFRIKAYKEDFQSGDEISTAEHWRILKDIVTEVLSTSSGFNSSMEKIIVKYSFQDNFEIMSLIEAIRDEQAGIIDFSNSKYIAE